MYQVKCREQVVSHDQSVCKLVYSLRMISQLKHVKLVLILLLFKSNATKFKHKLFKYKGCCNKNDRVREEN